MSQTFQKLMINRNDQTKKNDRFYISFYGINKNVGNYLGTQVKSVTRPDTTIEVINHNQRGSEFTDTGLLRFSEVEMTLTDDEESITGMLLYAQLMRQKKKYKGELDYIFTGEHQETYKFGVKLEMHNSLGDVTEGYMLKDCFIKSIRHSQAMYSSDEPNEIVISLAYDNIGVKIFDQYVDLTA